VTKHTSSIEEIVASDVRAWIALALKCSRKCPLIHQMKNEVKSMETLMHKQKEENDRG